MKIKWLGHACFIITSEDGTRILTDPFNQSVGYKVPEVEAEIVTISHEHGDHNYVNAVKSRYVKFDKPGKYSSHGISITGVMTSHDDAGGSKRGENAVFVFDPDGIRVCHCGDLGHPLTEKQLEQIGKVDVLLVPVGGTYTIDAAGALKVVKQLAPKLVIPMHFKTPATTLPIEGVERFLAAAGGVRANMDEIEIKGDDFGGYKGVVVLEYA